MKYKNITKKTLKFRAHEPNGVKTSFKLKPGKDIELYFDNLKIEGLEKITKTKKGDK